MNEVEAIIKIITVLALPAITAITFHEAAHGWVAWKLGDDTAWKLGRVTLNPLVHIDLFGTIILPLLLLIAQVSAGQAPFVLGWAKPVPVDFRRLARPRRDMALVALAGPVTNLFLAMICALLLPISALAPDILREWAITNLVYGISFNLLLMVLNLLPIPPLDGGRIAVGFLPLRLARPLARVEPYGMIILISLLILLPLFGTLFDQDWSPLAYVIGTLVDGTKGILLEIVRALYGLI